MVLLFNSKLRLFLGKLTSWCSEPFQVTRAFYHGVIEVWSECISSFEVDG